MGRRGLIDIQQVYPCDSHLQNIDSYQKVLNYTKLLYFWNTKIQEFIHIYTLWKNKANDLSMSSIFISKPNSTFLTNLKTQNLSIFKTIQKFQTQHGHKGLNIVFCHFILGEEKGSGSVAPSPHSNPSLTIPTHLVILFLFLGKYQRSHTSVLCRNDCQELTLSFKSPSS